jgi:hypothetical protein
MTAANSNRAQGVLYESEATLRLVDNELDAFQGAHDRTGADRAAEAASAPFHALHGLGDLAAVLDRANAQIVAVLSRLREGRAAMQHTAVVRITQDKLREVTAATEDAATNIMDACDRATGLVDELDGLEHHGSSDRDKAASLRGALRDELFLMMGALQFQDITSQQLAHASAVLDEMEQRMLEVARLFDPAMTLELPMPLAQRPDVELAYDTNATTRNADNRQALADSIFTAMKGTTA